MNETYLFGLSTKWLSFPGAVNMKRTASRLQRYFSAFPLFKVLLCLTTYKAPDGGLEVGYCKWL
jgi:hypothetical protein